MLGVMVICGDCVWMLDRLVLLVCFYFCVLVSIQWWFLLKLWNLFFSVLMIGLLLLKLKKLWFLMIIFWWFFLCVCFLICLWICLCILVVMVVILFCSQLLSVVSLVGLSLFRLVVLNFFGVICCCRLFLIMCCVQVGVDRLSRMVIVVNNCRWEKCMVGFFGMNVVQG